MSQYLSDQNKGRIGRAFGLSAVVLSVTGLLILTVLGRWDFLTGTDALYFGVLGIGFGSLTWVMIVPQSRNGSVWALAWASLFAGLFTAGVAFAVLFSRGSTAGFDYETLRQLSSSDLPLPAALALSFRFWAVFPAIWLPLTAGLLLFPDGRPLGPVWRLVGWLSITAIAVGTTATAIAQHPWNTLPISSAENTLPGTIGSVIDTSFLASSLGALLSVVSLIVRYRRSSGPTRSQIRWIALGGGIFLIALIGGPQLETSSGGEVLSAVIGVAAFGFMTVSYGIAITKHRLYGIDVIVSKSVTYVGLAAVITVLYAAVVVVPLLVIGQPDGDGGPGLMLPIIATAIVAVLFEPIRSRMQRWANRLVYGNRSTPHEVLSTVTARLADAAAGSGTGDLAKLLAEGIGAERAMVWLRSGNWLHPAGRWPDDGSSTLEPVMVGELIDDEYSESRPVLHGEDLFGALSVTKPRNDPITPADRQLLSDVAAGAGLLLRNISLNRLLEERAHQLRESRRRLIAAQDTERHRLERDLHDGAQQQVVALKVKLSIARTIAEREQADEIASRIASLAQETQEAVEALRAVAHGIYPPLLESEGLEPALRATQRSTNTDLIIETNGLVRYSREVEETAYFFLLETAERARMSGSNFIRADVHQEQGELVIEVEHDGRTPRTELAPVADRIDVLGGRTEVVSSANRTRITSHLPTVLAPA